MSKQTLYLLQYNNYYNRTIKSYNTLKEYLDNETVLYFKSDLNFHYADGVNTTHTLNCGEIDEPDYMLVYDQDSQEFSRWFIIEMTRERNSQYTFSLRRDLIADFKPEVLGAPSFIEKATISSIRDPAIYNNESMTFNQIKVKEKLIQDETRIPWIVGYVAKNTFTSEVSISAEVPDAMPADIEVNTLRDWAYYDYVTNNTPIAYQNIPTATFRFKFDKQTKNYEIKFSPTDAVVNKVDNSDKFTGTYSLSGQNANVEAARAILPLKTPQFWAFYQSWYQSNFVTGDEDVLLALNGKILKTTESGDYYKIKVRETDRIDDDDTPGSYEITDPAFVTYADSKLDRTNVISGTTTANTWTFRLGVSFYKISLEQVTSTASSIITRDHYHLLDAPYDMFCIPYGSIALRTSALSTIHTLASPGLNIASAISTQMGAGAIFDIQLLPYCPCRELLNPVQGTLDAYKGSFSPITMGNGTVSAIIWCQYSEINFSRPCTAAWGLDEEFNPIEKKVESETEFVRLCSPNYSGVFEFSPQKNNGVRAFNISCKYKPFSPYIHVAPAFNKDSLYGNDYNDARGLTCSGDFSLTQMTDAWATYQLNNKNYQNSFDRQIANLETNNSIQRTLDKWNAFAGTVSGTTSGALIGGTFGGAGAVAGGIAGGVASGLAGLADLKYSEMLRNEALDYTIDQFGYNLRNIQALPQSVAKIDAFNQQNKIFPFLEYYSCTDIEKDALRKKIKYDGMTIMRIGTLSEFIQEEPTYIKARLIRLEDAGDFHLVKEIANELNKGVFI